MWSIDDIIQSYLKPRLFEQDFSDQIKHLAKTNQIDWDNRVRNSAMLILAAICFRETVIASHESKDSLIYQPIGLYYSMFHISRSMLWLNPRVATKNLPKMSHNNVINSVKSQLIQTKFIDGSFSALLVNLKDLRESCNYQFCFQDNLEFEITQALEDTNKAFDNAFKFIHQVLHESNSLLRLQVTIGDGFGDDILDSYLSSEHKENVVLYLVTNALTS
jgi:uncharacterized protein (UPF0332 family)